MSCWAHFCSKNTSVSVRRITILEERNSQETLHCRAIAPPSAAADTENKHICEWKSKGTCCSTLKHPFSVPGDGISTRFVQKTILEPVEAA